MEVKTQEVKETHTEVKENPAVVQQAIIQYVVQENDNEFTSNLSKVKLYGGLKGVAKGFAVGTLLAGAVTCFNYAVNQHGVYSPFDLPFYVFESSLFLASCAVGYANGVRNEQREYLEVLASNAERFQDLRRSIEDSKASRQTSLESKID